MFSISNRNILKRYKILVFKGWLKIVLVIYKRGVGDLIAILFDIFSVYI